MKTKMVKGKHEFDYPLDGILFLPCERVCILQRVTGEQAVITKVDLEAKLKAKDFEKIESDLQLTNLYTSPTYQIMGLADEQEHLGPTGDGKESL